MSVDRTTRTVEVGSDLVRLRFRFELEPTESRRERAGAGGTESISGISTLPCETCRLWSAPSDFVRI